MIPGRIYLKLVCDVPHYQVVEIFQNLPEMLSQWCSCAPGSLVYQVTATFKITYCLLTQHQLLSPLARFLYVSLSGMFPSWSLPESFHYPEYKRVTSIHFIPQYGCKYFGIFYACHITGNTTKADRYAGAQHMKSRLALYIQCNINFFCCYFPPSF